MTDSSWSPGREVEIVAQRLRLRSLRPSDITGNDAPRWYGDGERRQHIWAPPIPSGEFLRGLAASCDRRRFFAFLALRKDSGEAVGLSKAQIMPEGKELLYVTTTLVGEAHNEAMLLGYEITSASLWFAATQLPVHAFSMRIYEANEKSIELLKHFGYELHSTKEESSSQGTRLVHDYRKRKDDWLETYRKRFSNWAVQQPSD